jgi:hypothetical protein
VHRRNGSFFTGLVIGVVAGLMAGLVGVAHSTTGKKAWERFGDMFQAGYVTGFLDCVRIAKAMDYEGYVSTNYAIPPNAKASHFQAWITDAYKDPKSSDRTVPQLLVFAGYKLQGQFGTETLQTGNPSTNALHAVMESRRKAILEAERAKKELDAAKAADGATPGQPDQAKTPPAPAAATDNGVETKPGEASPGH